MTKWYEETDQMHDVYVMNRLRLVRNINGHVFPGRMNEEERAAMLSELEQTLIPQCTTETAPYTYYHLHELSDTQLNALYERRAINHSRIEEKGAAGVALSLDESVSLVLNGEDHIRLQYVSSNLSLMNIWTRLTQMDDAVGERIPYAFDPKYGYLTSFLTNVGTGLRASVIVHLPMLSTGNQFRKLIQEYTRFGVSIKGLAGDSNENFGALYEVKNQKTLGQTEQEIIKVVSQAAGQLAAQERKVRSLALRSHHLQLEDEAYKSYGVLKYARKLTYKEAMTYLSQLRLGLCEGLIEVEKPVNLFGIMLNIRPANLKLNMGEAREGIALDEARAQYIREHLPEIR